MTRPGSQSSKPIYSVDMNRNRILAVTSLAMLIVACAPRQEGPAPAVDAAMVARAQAQWPDADAAQLRRGHDLLFTSCAECHARPGPTSAPAHEWPSIMKSMSRKAKLSADQHEAVLRYLIAGGP